MASIFTLLGQKTKSFVDTKVAALANGAVATNATNIAANVTSISTNAAGIITNASAISAKYDKTGGTVAGDMTVTGSLTVQGTTTSVSTTVLEVSDSLINLSKGASGSNNATNDGGIVIERGSSEKNVALVWDEGTDRFTAYESSSAQSFDAGDTDITVADSTATFAKAQFDDIYVNADASGTATNLGMVAEFEAELV